MGAITVHREQLNSERGPVHESAFPRPLSVKGEKEGYSKRTRQEKEDLFLGRGLHTFLEEGSRCTPASQHLWSVYTVSQASQEIVVNKIATYHVFLGPIEE